MSGDGVILPADCIAYRMLSTAARRCRVVIFAGLPGVGKTFMLQQMTLLAHAAGRRLTLLQWDIARQAFETPEILALYPEIAGTTHAAIRLAAGYWVRDAVSRWSTLNSAPAAMLLGEAPFVGHRLIELARPEADAAEALLAAPTTEFLIPAPSLAVRRAIEIRRAQESANPRDAREAANANPALVVDLMQALRAAGAALGMAHALEGVGYDPAVYVEVYRRVLVHRHVQALPIDACLPVMASAYDLAVPVVQLQPTPSEVTVALSHVRQLPVEALDAMVNAWYLPAGE